jgi:hypothetical protein
MADHHIEHRPLAHVFDHPVVRELIDSLVWFAQGLDAAFGAVFGEGFVDWLLAELENALRGRGSSAGPRRATRPGPRLTST